MTDQLSLSSMSELVSAQSDSGRANRRTMITCRVPRLLNGCASCLWTACYYLPHINDGTLTNLHNEWISVRNGHVSDTTLFLQSSMSTGTRIVACQLTRAGTTQIISQLLQRHVAVVHAGASCMIYSVLPRDMHAATVMSPEIALWWVHGLPGPPTSRIIPQWCHACNDLTETSKPPPCCPVIL